MSKAIRADVKSWVNFEGINAAALAASPELLKKWLPRGRVVGRKFLVGNLQGDPGDSLKVNLTSGQWADFATNDAGGDLVALYAAIHRLDQATAARTLANELGVANDTAGRHGPNAHRPDQWRSILPPATPPPNVVQHPSLGRADTTWTYCDATGTPLLIVCRWNRIGRSKTIRPLSYGVLNGTEGWHFKHPEAPRPLFGLDRLAARPNAEVLLVEGEKAADAAQRLLPKMVAMTWPGGANAIRHADWTTLAGRTIIIWPDNDEAGRKAGKTVAGLLRRVGAASISLVDPPANVCQGWDLADAASDGWDSQRVASWLAKHSRALSAGHTVQRSDGEEPRSPRFSDDQLALRFTAELGDELRYIHPWGKWLRWDGRRWSFDQTLAVPDRARGICRVAATECWDPKEQNAIASAKKVAAVERLARSDRQHAATVEQWDTHPWLLPTPVGEVSLRLGEISPARPEHYMTKITTVAPEGKCPLWQQFLERVTDGDKELQLYLQRVVGYCLTGSVEEEALFFLHGTGQNGKGVFIHTLAGIFGEFHTAAPMEMFLFSKHDRHPTELAGLRGARLVTCTEVEQGRRWDEAKIKALTGSDTISARFMRQDFFNFVPTFKLVISGNHKPSLSHVDKAISRRFHLIPFTVTIPDDERDDKLAEKLKGEWPGILQWAIDGAVEWARIGLAPPEAVLEATQEYLSAQDSISLWIEEHCTEGANEQETIAKLWTSWRTWCDQTNDYSGKKTGFVEALVTRRYRRTTIGKAGAKGLTGIRLLRTGELEIESSQDVAR